jgi:hypothetical protein
MPRNIVIFSDGTGQRGGIHFDERRSNIYKLYRGTRAGPDSTVDANAQRAFYDPGIGSLPGGIDSLGALIRSAYNIASQATGMGITKNITDCYAEIIRLWEPGDRIFLFGFSRGAYTARCLAGVLKCCGVPRIDAGGVPIRRDPGTAHSFARQGVRIYNYTNSRPEHDRTPRQAELLAQRASLAAQFRERHGCDGNNGGNARPYFIGVFDTVASLSNPESVAMVALFGTLALALISLASICLPGSYLQWFVSLLVIGLLGSVAINLLTRLRWAPKLPGIPWWRTIHLTTVRMKMYDTDLDGAVTFARHAIAIDERRASFERVPWGQPSEGARPPVNGVESFVQEWFAGDHSDIGGSYAEDESRLSDITLQWMVTSAAQAGLLYDTSVLQCYPSPTGMQHDEARSSIFKYAGKKTRLPPADAPLHQSVIERFQASEVLQYDTMVPYRPDGLRNHDQVKQFYS